MAGRAFGTRRWHRPGAGAGLGGVPPSSPHPPTSPCCGGMTAQAQRMGSLSSVGTGLC